MGEEEDPFAAQVEQRWGFLSPWWEALKPCITYYNQYSPGEYVWQLPEILVKVVMPRREASNNEDEAAFRRRFQEVREALALLVAVEHADYDAYDHILTDKCGVYHGRYGEEVSEVSIAVKFMLDVNEEGHKIHGDAAEGIEYDLVRLCGTDQREHPSEGYLSALSQIAALDDNLKSGEAVVDITIPVKVDFCAKFAENVAGTLNYANKLRDIAKAEKAVDAQWEAFCRRRGEDELDSRAIRCTFALEPMSANTGLMELTRELAEALECLVADNVWFSFVDLPVSFQREGLSELEARKTLGQLLRRVLDSTCRSQRDAHINYSTASGLIKRPPKFNLNLYEK